MAIAKVADRGSANNETDSATTLVDMAAAGSITVGNYLIVRVAADNSGGGGAARSVTVSDPRLNSWTTLTQANQDPGSASAGTTCSIAYCKVTNAFTNGDDITITYGGNVIADAVVVEEWSGIHATSPIGVAVTTTAGAGTALGGIARTPTAADQLFYAAGSIEGPNADSYTEDSDTTAGSWVSLTRTGTANATAASNQKVVGAYKLVTATDAQTWTATITSRDWAAVAVVFAAAAAVVDQTGTDSGTLGELTTLTVAAAGSDTATLGEAGSVTVTAVGSDSGAIGESPSIAATLPDSDSAALAEAGIPVEALEVADSDSFTAADATYVLEPGPAADAATLTESSAIAASVASVDSGTAAETSTVDLSDSDSAALGDTGTAAVAAVATDTGALGESPSVAATLPDSDSVAFAEVSATAGDSADKDSSDTASLGETVVSLPATLAHADSATLGENAVVEVAVVSADTGTLGDTGAQAASLDLTDTATINELFASITATLADLDARTFTDTGSSSELLSKTDSDTLTLGESGSVEETIFNPNETGHGDAAVGASGQMAPVGANISGVTLGNAGRTNVQVTSQ